MMKVNNFVELLEGTTINGEHIHVYKNRDNGLLDVSVEVSK